MSGVVGGVTIPGSPGIGDTGGHTSGATGMHFGRRNCAEADEAPVVVIAIINRKMFAGRIVVSLYGGAGGRAKLFNTSSGCQPAEVSHQYRKFTVKLNSALYGCGLANGTLTAGLIVARAVRIARAAVRFT